MQQIFLGASVSPLVPPQQERSAEKVVRAQHERSSTSLNTLVFPLFCPPLSEPLRPPLCGNCSWRGGTSPPGPHQSLFLWGGSISLSQ